MPSFWLRSLPLRLVEQTREDPCQGCAIMSENCPSDIHPRFRWTSAATIMTSNNACVYVVQAWAATSEQPATFASTILAALDSTGVFVGYTRGAVVYAATKTQGESATVVVVRDELTSRVFLFGALGSSCGPACTRTPCTCSMAHASDFYVALSTVATGVSPSPPPYVPPFFDGCDPLPTFAVGSVCTRVSGLNTCTLRDLCAQGFGLNGQSSGALAWPGVLDATYTQLSAQRYDGARIFVIYVTVAGRRTQAMATVVLPNTDFYVANVDTALSPSGLAFAASARFPCP